MNEKTAEVKTESEVVYLDERSIADKIYEIRGVKVMLDFELAELYGYSTKAFNQQVKNNSEKFDNDFRFQLTRQELEEISRSKNLTSIQMEGIRGGRAYLPYAFTEQGIYMLMTVLKGELATKQSKALIRTFKAMKDYIIENRNVIGQNEYLRLSLQITDSIKDSFEMRHELNELGSQMSEVIDKLSNVVERSEIAPFMLDMGKPAEKRSYLLLDGQPLKAVTAYIDIYGSAEQSVFIVDNYIGPKTLHLLQEVKDGAEVIIFSDNLGYKLRKSDYDDFCTEFPNINLRFRRTCGTMHDRFIILDYGLETERLFFSGASSKDAGNRTTIIEEIQTKEMIDGMHAKVEALLNNPELELN